MHRCKYDGCYSTDNGHIFCVKWHKALFDAYYVVWKWKQQCYWCYSAKALGKQISKEKWNLISKEYDYAYKSFS